AHDLYRHRLWCRLRFGERFPIRCFICDRLQYLPGARTMDAVANAQLGYDRICNWTFTIHMVDAFELGKSDILVFQWSYIWMDYEYYDHDCGDLRTDMGVHRCCLCG